MDLKCEENYVNRAKVSVNWNVKWSGKVWMVWVYWAAWGLQKFTHNSHTKLTSFRSHSHFFLSTSQTASAHCVCPAFTNNSRRFP